MTAKPSTGVSELDGSSESAIFREQQRRPETLGGSSGHDPHDAAAGFPYEDVGGIWATYTATYTGDFEFNAEAKALAQS